MSFRNCMMRTAGNQAASRAEVPGARRGRKRCLCVMVGLVSRYLLSAERLRCRPRGRLHPLPNPRRTLLPRNRLKPGRPGLLCKRLVPTTVLLRS
jgi:hypothetical protein